MPIINTALTLKDLPPPPPGKTGWPWTEQTEPLPKYMPNGSEWSRISIITPSYNQEQFIEETIRSVLLQGYPNLEYIIIDGGSTDNSIEIIKKYEPYLAYWVSEKDRGQSHAINKGINIATGDILGWLNSDDYFLKSAFASVVRHAPLNEIGSAFWLVGNGFEKVEDTVEFNIYPTGSSFSSNELAWSLKILQPTVFWSRDMNAQLDDNLHYAMDWDLWNRFAKKVSGKVMEEFVAVSRIYPNTKTATGKDKMADEFYLITRRYGGSPLLSLLYRYALWEPKHRGAGKSLSIASLIPKIWLKLGRITTFTLFGREALNKYTWDFCA